MEMQQIAHQLGVETYPACFEQIYAQISGNGEPACNLKAIEKAQREFQAFGEYYDAVMEAAKQINEDPACSAWVKVSSEFMSDEKWGHYSEIHVPPFNGTLKQDLLMLFALIPFIPSAAARYRKNGFDAEQTAEYMETFGSCIGNVERKTGNIGLNQTYFRWLYPFAKAEIFKVHGIQFELAKLKPYAIYLRSVENGTIVPVITKGLFHASGKQRLDTIGFTDSEGAFEVSLTEDENQFCGHGAYNGVVSKEPQVFPKSQWTCIARPGDKCVSMHLPKGADITRESVQKAYDAACELLRKNYPDYCNTPVQCLSWLMDPGLEDILGADSKIVRFGKLFVRYPGKTPAVNTGRAADSFVFPEKCERLEDLPENTRLQRGLKQHYLNGGYTYSYAGILVL